MSEPNIQFLFQDFVPAEFEDLEGHTILSFYYIEESNGEMAILYLKTKTHLFKLVYLPDCCSFAELIEGLDDLKFCLNTPILLAECVTQSGVGDEECKKIYFTTNRQEELAVESFTWTFYKLSTRGWSTTLRWLGESNGCYSEEISVFKAKLKN